MKYTDIKTHEDACKVLGKDPSHSTTTDQQITDVFNAVNKLSGFKVDFNDLKRRKWRLYFIVDISGFRFVFSGYDYSVSLTSVGSRLCHYVETEGEANHIGTQFFELFKAHFFGE